MRCLQTVLLTVVMLSLIFLPTSISEADDIDGKILIDMGNGETYWSDITGTGSCIDIAKDTASALNLDFVSSDSGIVCIGDMREHSVGDQACIWNLYTWTDDSWLPSDSGSIYKGGYIAWGFYPKGSITPTETPDNMVAWTQSRGDSSSSGVSDSSGTDSAVTPVEWYRTYTTGMACSSIIVSGDRLYHTTNGSFGGTTTDSHAWIYCIDRLTGEKVWDFDLSTGGQDITVRAPGGYDITSPLIVGDLVIINSTTEYTNDSGKSVMYIYCLDSLTGDVIAKQEIVHSPPLDENGDVMWTGRVFVTGGTTPIYDSGAIYFGTSDGRVLSYSVSRESGFQKLWEYIPTSTMSGDTYTGTRGSFYFHSPVISDVDGERTLFIGNYEGYLFSIDASTGKLNWVVQEINLGAANKPHPGTPGSVNSITVTSEGKLLVGCSDGGLSSLTGYTLCVDASTGKGPDGSECYWKIEALMNGPVLDDDGFYSYVSPSGETHSLSFADGTQIAIHSAIYKFDYDGNVVWVSSDYQTIKAQLTLADGRLYAMDYSAGVFYPSGGGLMSINAEDGSEIWRLKLSPFSENSYSMVSPTVIDGRIYVGNDYGAIYCVSEVAGPVWDGGKEIVLKGGLNHWSWIVLFVVVVLALMMLYRFY